MAISNDVLSSTLRILLDEEVDQLYQATPLLDKMRERGGVITYDGGQKLNVPLILEEHSSITQLDSGYEPVNLAVKDALRQAEFNWCDFVAPIVVTRSEELSNKGERAIIDIAEARMKSVMGALKREVEKQILVNASTILTNLNTFNGLSTADGGAGSGNSPADGGDGAAGVVILRMATADYSGTTSGSPTVDQSTVSGQTILIFNASGSYTA